MIIKKIKKNLFQKKMTFNPKIMQLLFKLFICIQYLTFVCPIARACIQLLIDRDLVEMIDPG